MNAVFRSGLVALIGRPNVGKSTLLNRLLGTKVSITSPRPQTTRARILGIKTLEHAQIVYVDTPGIPGTGGRRIQRVLQRAAVGGVEGVDCIVLVISAEGWRREDAEALRLARRQPLPVILAINKIDRVRDRARLLPLMKESSEQHAFAEIVPLSARTGKNTAELEAAILKYLPAQPPIYPPEQVTDKSERFLAAELVREQVFRGFGQEIPYSAAVRIEQFRRRRGVLHVAATLWVEKEGQKAILIGKSGARLKTVGERARREMQKLFSGKVYLELWVKVRHGWADSARALRDLGYGEES
jgi:GTP-binding protein Era